jgi:Holliday junction DNA helicase RuvA
MHTWKGKSEMISYLKGEIAEIKENILIVEVNQIGYEIFVPASLTMEIGQVGTQVKIYTYFHVREDAMQLYGFLSKDDLEIFKLLIGVNGIGPKAGLGILSGLTADDIRFAILSDDVKTIMQAPGIGKKTAQKLILELRDKVNLEEAFEQKLVNEQAVSGTGTSDAKNEAVQALAALGYSNSEALRAVNQVEIKDDMDAEMILKASLKKIMIL